MPPAVGHDTGSHSEIISFDLPSFCRTFDFFRLHFDDYELEAKFPADTKDESLSQDGVLRHGQLCSLCYGDNETGIEIKIPGKRLSERSKRKKIG
jgi:hypothetical protein